MQRQFTIALSIAAALAALSLARAQVPPRSGPRSPGVVLLASGQVLHGTVTDEGSQWLVTLGPGSQLRLAREQIVCTGRTLEDVFAFQHRRLAEGDVAGRIELARWCLRCNLPTAAGRVMVELVALAPDDQRVVGLEQQLRRQAQRPARALAATSATLPPADELKTVADQLSPPAFDAYVRHIQPLLVNHCSASGCHGVASKSQFQLLRPLTGVKLTQRMTQRNLHATLAQINRQSPLTSPMLAAFTQPHAGAAAPLVDEQTGREQIAALKEWLAAIQEQPAAKGPKAPAAAPATVLLQPREAPTSLQTPSEPRRSPAESIDAGRAAGDAEEFNRRFFPERFQPAQPAVP